MPVLALILAFEFNLVTHNVFALFDLVDFLYHTSCSIMLALRIGIHNQITRAQLIGLQVSFLYKLSVRDHQLFIGRCLPVLATKILCSAWLGTRTLVTGAEALAFLRIRLLNS